MDRKLSIQINIADRYYPLKVERTDEEKIRRAAKMINNKIQQYKERFKDKDMQDFLAMTSLQFVTKVLESETKINSSNIVESISEINLNLEEYLNLTK